MYQESIVDYVSPSSLNWSLYQQYLLEIFMALQLQSDIIVPVLNNYHILMDKRFSSCSSIIFFNKNESFSYHFTVQSNVKLDIIKKGIEYNEFNHGMTTCNYGVTLSYNSDDGSTWYTQIVT